MTGAQRIAAFITLEIFMLAHAPLGSIGFCSFQYFYPLDDIPNEYDEKKKAVQTCEKKGGDAPKVKTASHNGEHPFFERYHGER